ncbi:MAG: hypothetical protein ACRCTK_01730, partial [Alphaproteobacteria bacterium]
MSKVQLIQEMLEPSIESLGYDVVRVILSKAKRPVLQVMIDRIDGHHVSIEDCTRVSETVSTLLDVEDPLEQRYILEVTSPGSERPIVKPKDFVRFSGRTIKINVHPGEDGRKQFQGALEKVEERGIFLALPQQEPLFFEWKCIVNAKLVNGETQEVEAVEMEILEMEATEVETVEIETRETEPTEGETPESEAVELEALDDMEGEEEESRKPRKSQPPQFEKVYRSEQDEEPKKEWGKSDDRDRPRRDDGERRLFGDRPPRRDDGERRPFGDRPPRRDDGERRPFGDRPPRRDDGERRSFGDRPPRRNDGERRPFGDRPRRDDGERRPFGDRPRRDDGERR